MPNLSRLLNRLPELDPNEATRIIQELEALAARLDGETEHPAPDDRFTQAVGPSPETTSRLPEQALLEAVLRALPVGMWITDPGGHIIHKNPHIDSIWAGEGQRAAPGNIPRTYQYRNPETGQLVPPQELPMAQALAHGLAIYNTEMDIQRFDDTFGTVLASAAPVRDREGRLVGAVAALQDITAQKQIERRLRASQAQLRESELRFHLALDNTPIIVFEMDSDLRYTWLYNTSWQYANESVLGKRDDELLGPEAAAEIMAIKRQALESGQPLRKEIAFSYNGEPAIYRLAVEPLRDEQGNPYGLIGTALDLTLTRVLERQQIEQRAQIEVQRRLQEQRELERQEIARQIHDGPIQCLASAMFNLRAAREVENKTDAQEMLQEASDSLKISFQNLRSLINELRPPALVRFGLARAIQLYTDDLSSRYPDLSIELDVIDDERLLPEETALAVYRISQESLLNAARHARASQVSVRYTPVGNELVLEIEDNGIGFLLPKDWVDLTRSENFGLAGMRERAETVGGRLKIRTEPGQGTRVCLILPLPQPDKSHRRLPKTGRG